MLLDLILAYPTWDSIKGLPEPILYKFFIDHNYRRTRSIARILKRILCYDQQQGSAVQRVLAEEAQTVAHILQVLKERLKRLETRMKQIMLAHPLGPVFDSIPGAGKVLAGKLMALFGDDKDRFIKAGEIQALFGTAPVNFQTGNYHKVHMRRGCNREARATLYYFSFCSMRYCSWARAYYDRQRARGKTHAVSVRALSNKWIRVLFQLWKHEQPYDERRCSGEISMSVA